MCLLQQKTISETTNLTMTDLDPNTKDRLVSLAKGVAGACPMIGSLVSEAIGAFIPEQRLDRAVEFLRNLDAEVRVLDNRLENFERNLQTPEGLDVMEEGLMQAARSVAQDRKEKLARLVGRSLTNEELKYEESRKLLNLFRELTDPEILWLIFYSMNPTLGHGPHTEMVEKNPKVFKPISRVLGAPQEQIDQAALQDSYKNTLVRLGLVEHDGKSHRITALGSLMMRYIAESPEKESES